MQQAVNDAVNHTLNKVTSKYDALFEQMAAKNASAAQVVNAEPEAGKNDPPGVIRTDDPAEVAQYQVTPEAMAKLDEFGNVEELYGNKDKKKQFNLAKLLPAVTKIPDDKFVIVIQKHNINADKTTTEDVSARRAQVIDASDYAKNTKPLTDSGESVYDTLFGNPGIKGGWVMVHEAKKK